MTRRTPRGKGRPTLLTPDTQNRILKAIRNGTPITAAATAAGITFATYANWQNRGQAAQDLAAAGMEIPDKERIFVDFVEATARARAEGLENRLAKVAEIAEGGFVVKETTRTYSSKQGPVQEVERQYAPPDWRALAWVLERSHREFFGKAERVELTGADGGPVAVSHAEVDALALRIRSHVDRVAGRVIEGQVSRQIEGSAVDASVIEGSTVEGGAPPADRVIEADRTDDGQERGRGVA